MLQETVSITCPYCGENIAIQVDCSAGSQAYIEDCQVCCRPIELQIECDQQGDFNGITVKRDDD